MTLGVAALNVEFTKSQREVRERQEALDRDTLVSFDYMAVDHEGEVLESYITRPRNKDAALTSMKKALMRHGSPEAITTDGLRSYRAAMKDPGNAENQEVARWANNRVENSHLPFRQLERAMLGFRRMSSLQKFASVHANVYNQFNLERHLVDRTTFKERRSAALAEWQTVAS